MKLKGRGNHWPRCGHGFSMNNICENKHTSQYKNKKHVYANVHTQKYSLIHTAGHVSMRVENVIELRLMGNQDVFKGHVDEPQLSNISK